MAYLSAPKTARYSFSSLKSCYAQFCFYFGSRLRTSIASFAITYLYSLIIYILLHVKPLVPHGV